MKRNQNTKATNSVAAELLKRIFVDCYKPDHRFDKAIEKSIKERAGRR